MKKEEEKEMMNKDTLKRKSKLLALILRHQPSKAGLTLGEGGWVDIADLLAGLDKIKKPMPRQTLQLIVDSNDKKRFTISKDGKRIRAAQGHSVDVDLELKPVTPPAVLYHGTAKCFLDPILRDGLKTMRRDHVHLSADLDTASKVGRRHGVLVILKIDAQGLHAAGQKFYQADNGVWLTKPIAKKWFEIYK